MKKTIAILLVAVLAVSSVFAGFSLSGEANVKLVGNFDDKTLGFTNGDNKVKVAIEGATAEKVNEGDIYAGIKAVLSFKASEFKNGSKDFATADKPFITVDKLEISEAYITDGNWKLSILSAAATPTFAKGWETVKKGNDKKDVVLSVAVGKDVPGVTVEYAGWKVGAGLDVNFNEGGAKNGMLTIATPAFAFDAVTVKAGAGAANTTGKLTIGGGAEAKYATDAFTASVAGDVVYGKVGNTFDAAVRGSVAYAPVTVDAFYATKTDLKDQVVTYVDRAYAGKDAKENYLSAKVACDLNGFDVPVTITAVGLDLVKDQYFDVEAKATVSGVNGTVFGGYQISNKTYHVGVAADYTLEKVGKIYGQFDLSGDSALKAAKVKVGVENTTLVSGATLKLEYAGVDFVAKKAGAVTASAQIKF
ncbi:MAG: hypothetical protein MR563_09045 [Spirochaetales bacterium]|nr:hypothetical protein [Spirochaetales bacterium]